MQFSAEVNCGISTTFTYKGIDYDDGHSLEAGKD